MSETPIGRRVAVILVAGALVGLAHNWTGLAGRPARGIPWRATPVALPDLESLTPTGEVGDTAGSPGTLPEGSTTGARDQSREALDSRAGEVAGGDEGEPASRAGGTTAAGRSAAEERPGGGVAPAAGGGSSAPRPAASSDPPAAAIAPPGSRPSAPLPFIPEMDQPLQVKIGVVKRFFDARAALFLDARDPGEFEAGHIPGALRLTVADAAADPERLKTLPVQGRPIIAYCEGGRCEASLDLARMLAEAGYRKVLVYMGGYPEWEAAGYPVERGASRP